MVIGIDARELAARPAGKGQYLGRLIQCWMPAAARGEHALVLYIVAGTFLPAEYRGEGVTLVEQKGRGPLWHRGVAGRLSTDGVTVFFAALSYLSSLANSIPTVTVVHDLAVFRLPALRHNRQSKIVERLTLRACARRSRKLIAVSHNTKRDLTEIMKVRPAKIEVIYPATVLIGGVQKPLSRVQRQPYLLFVGTLEPRKNIGTILRAYAALPLYIRDQYRLKLAGKPGWGGEDYEQIAAVLELTDRVDFLGYVSDAQLVKLYREAVALVYPSLYEGFGLPPLEAMSVGTPVVSSDISSLPEVVGGGGILCAPDDVSGISAGIQRLIEDTDFWQMKSEAAVERASQFSWREAAQAVLQELSSVSNSKL